ncbi:MAG: DUF3943 domain-containing protein [Candidatus Delongbacteria bacterium]|nr:DUF3943 domain-containing protein [Candidatus Delongbacteria bacterium]
MANSLIALSNNYIFGQDYAKISFKSIERNLTGEWEWDADNFEVNQIGHPFQGSVYFSSARNNGHSYLSGAAFTAAGSLQWEYFMETEKPSVNDFVTTTMGGSMLGEMINRLSYKILDDDTKGAERFLRESSVFIINPAMGVNRLINPEFYQRSQKIKYKDIPLKIQISTSKNIIDRIISENLDMGNPDSVSTGPFANYNLRVIYGDPYTAERCFDYFLLFTGFSVNNDLIGNVSARALLWKKNVNITDKAHNAFGVFQNFDYISSPDYSVGANSLGFEFMARTRSKKGWSLSSEYQAGFIIMGAATTEYYVDIERDYNLGPGAYLKIIMLLSKPDIAEFSLNLNRFWIGTISGAEGIESIGLGSIEVKKNIYKNFSVGVSYNFYDREGYYADYPDVRMFYNEIKAIAYFKLI